MTALEFLNKLTGILKEMDVDEIADCEVYVANEDGDYVCPNVSVEDGNIYIYGRREV